MSEIIWAPQPGPQEEFCRRKEFEVFYGGAAGGGKSDAMLCEGLRQIHIPGYRAIYFRRTFPELQRAIDRSMEIFPAYDGKWNGESKRWVFPAGSFYRFGHMKEESDKYNYQSDEYAYIAFDELTQFTESQYTYLFSRCRTSAPGVGCYVRGASNPGNIGHAWVKRRFITPASPYTRFVDPETGLDRCFIPAKVYDNKILMQNDPGYVKRLQMLPEAERRKLLEGDWDVFAGQAFPELKRGVHVVKPFRIFPGWFKFASLDWGFARPFSIGWWAIDNDGRLIRYKEWYGTNGQPDMGTRLNAPEVARQAWEKSIGEGVQDMVADPACWHKMGHEGPSIAESFEEAGWFMHKGENNRLLGKQAIHNRLMATGENEVPMLLVFDTCLNWIRTVFELVLNESNPEDVDTKQEDHTYDDTRYAVMSAFSTFMPEQIRSLDPDRHYNMLRESGKITWMST